MNDSGSLAIARSAVARLAWDEAMDAFTDADREGPLLADDLAEWAMVAYLMGSTEISLSALNRAYQLYLDGGDPAGAARCGFWSAFTLFTRGEMAQANGWVGRSQRLMESLPADHPINGYLLAVESFRQVAIDGDYAASYETAMRAVAFGTKGGDADLVALGLNNAGRAQVRIGNVAGGMLLLDEAMVSVVSGELTPTVAGTVYCSLIEACETISEFQRAQEWTDALTRWCDQQQGMLTFNGQCLTHRSHLLRRHGDWSLAAAEALRACERFQGATDQMATGEPLYQLGEISRMTGDETAAEEFYGRATEWGRDPQPGLALLRLQQGRVEQAVAMMRRLITEARDDVDRCRLFPAYVEVMLKAGDMDSAAAAAKDLERLAGVYGTSAWRAEAQLALGAVMLDRGDADAGLAHLRRAYDAWQVLRVPYEAARTRVLIGLACRRMGDEDTARRELDAAEQAFLDLGAGPAVTALRQLRGGIVRAHPLTDRELEILALVARGETNREIADRLFIAVKTVDRHVANILAKLAVPSRTAATAWAYEHDLL